MAQSADRSGRAPRDEMARRWGDPQPPRAGWPDNSAGNAAESGVERIVTAGIGHHAGEADREEQTAAGLDRGVLDGDRGQAAARGTDERRAAGRQALEADRARITHNSPVRAETMTSEQAPGEDAAAPS